MADRTKTICVGPLITRPDGKTPFRTVLRVTLADAEVPLRFAVHDRFYEPDGADDVYYENGLAFDVSPFSEDEAEYQFNSAVVLFLSRVQITTGTLNYNEIMAAVADA